MADNNNTLHVLNRSKGLQSSFTEIRNKASPRTSFIFHANKIISLLIDQALELLEYKEILVSTPTGVDFKGLAYNSEICAVSIMRAGDAFVDVFRQVCPGIRIGKILIQRDEETALPKLFYSKLPPDVSKRTCFLVDPMLATGGSAIQAVEVLLDHKVLLENIIFVNLISCPEGLQALQKSFPTLRIVTGWVDECLNEQKYIIPGLGDFGCRYFGTTQE